MGRSFFGGEKVRVREGAMVRSFFVGCKGIRKGDLERLLACILLPPPAASTSTLSC